MPKFEHSDISPHSPQELASLVLDIARYPEFLPWCSKARIISGEPHQIVAELVVTFAGFNESYVSEVRIKRKKTVVEIDVHAISGPFSRLDNKWRFSKKATGTRIDFSIDFAFKSKILDLMMSPVFYKACQKMIAAFESRADELFGKR
ncbi:MAG: type II toxin-antitoxin system RatA family toxin [Proteobacteria bacterium]|nr:type II toxin-antitoxin system RatA family toxin [Pseudomonadota bacterium]